MARTAFKQCDVARLVRGAIAGGLPAGSFALQLVDGRPTLIPVDAPRSALKVAALDPDAALDAQIEALITRHAPAP